MTISLATIEAALRAEDIESLIEAGAPDDEYNSEAKKIAAALSSLAGNQLTEANIVAVIALAWAKAFNRSSQEIEMRMDAFHRIARRLLP